jgi:hypothetical protein
MVKLYRGDECFKLFKECYYKYCLYSPARLERKIKEMYEKMEYANDYYGIHVRTLGRLKYMNKEYKDHVDKFNSNFWFEIFIKGIEFHKYIFKRNGIKTN